MSRFLVGACLALCSGFAAAEQELPAFVCHVPEAPLLKAFSAIGSMDGWECEDRQADFERHAEEAVPSQGPWNLLAADGADAAWLYRGSIFPTVGQFKFKQALLMVTWTKQVLSEDGVVYASKQMMILVDCRRKRFGIQSVVYFPYPLLTGLPMQGFFQPDREQVDVDQKIEPDSPAQALHELACAK